ncbi:hypothetical protein LUZ60_015828 [Juncus effusus]|nr:hypothetical protein LUZ60_015828 [Juncus effusus]
MRAGFAPINSKEIYWFLVHYSSSIDKDIPTSPDLMLKEVTENLAKDFPSDFLTVAENLDLSTLSWAPLLFRAPWNVAFGPTQNGNVTVAGNAMHPMTPDLGQGGCSALEDAVILARCISQAQTPDEGIKRYVEERKWRVTWLVVGAWFSGWVQQGGGGDKEWWSKPAKWFRDHIFYKFVLPRIHNALWFDSGELTPVKQ